MSRAWAMFNCVTSYLSLWPWNTDFKKVKMLFFCLIYPGNKCLYKIHRPHLYTSISIYTWNIQDQLAVCFTEWVPQKSSISNRARYWCDLSVKKNFKKILHGTKTCIGVRWILIEWLMSINLRMWRDKRKNIFMMAFLYRRRGVTVTPRLVKDSAGKVVKDFFFFFLGIFVCSCFPLFTFNEWSCK